MKLYHKLAFEQLLSFRTLLSLIFLLLVTQNIAAQAIVQPEVMQKAKILNGERVIVQLKANTQTEGTLVAVTPNENYVINGIPGGPYTPGLKTYTLTNFNTISKPFQITSLPNWLIASETSGTLAASESIDITLSVNSNANGLNPGVHNAGILFNSTTRLAQITISNSIQANDLFANAQVISGLPISTFGTNFNTNKETGEPNHANNIGGNSVWWRWTAPSSGSISVDTFGSNFDTTLGIYIGNQVNNLTAIATNDDSINIQSQVVTKVTAGNTYYIAIDGYNGASGSIILNITPSTGTPNNDDFGNATIITGIPNISSGTNASATKQVGENNHANNSGGKSVWWVWSSPVSQEVTIATFGSNFDTILGIYTGNQVNSLTTIGSNDDATNFSTQSAVTFTPTKGVTYYIGVDGYSGDSGTISLNLSSTVPVNFPLQVTTIGNGTVISDISGINCPTKCSESYPSGTSLLLAASADDRWVFSGWSGDCTGTGVCPLTMLVERNVTATFKINEIPNIAPIAQNDTAGPINNAAVITIDVLTNDSDSDGSLVLNSVRIRTAPTNGNAVIDLVTGQIIYTHDGSATTSDSFSYTVEDNEDAISNQATVSVTINEDNTDTGDLIAHWPLDEGTGTVVADIENGYDGTLINGPIWAGSDLLFDGIDDYIDVGIIDVPSEALTLTAWAQSDNLENCLFQDCRILSKATGSSEQAHYWMLSTIRVGSATRLRFRLKAGGTTSTLIASTGNIINDELFHVAAVYDGTTMRLYKNGIEVGSLAKTGSIDENNAVNAWIGSNPTVATSRPWQGLLADVRIYQTALTTADVNTVKEELTQ